MKTLHQRSLVAALTVLAVLAAAQSATAKDTWTSVRSQNFFLVGNASEKEIRQVATRLEQFREVFTKLFTKVNFNTPVPTTVVVFKNDSAYKPFKPVADGKPVEVAGYFQSGEDVNYITLTPERAGGVENPYGTIYHEYTHLLVNNTTGAGEAPAWFNEGLAEYYSTFFIEEDRKVHLGRFVDYHIRLLRDQKLIPLSQLFAVTHYSLERNKHDVRSLFYAESWALVHYLILGNEGKRLPQLGEFLGLTKKGVPTDEAFRRAFQTDAPAVEKELQKYVQSNTFMSRVTTFPEKLEFDSQMTTAPLTEAQAEAYLGDLLLHINRPDDAAVRLQHALELDPSSVMARTSLGMVRLRQKRDAEAIAHLREAAAAGASTYLPHYYYAYALSRQGAVEGGFMPGYPPERAAEMRAELRKAISLRPDFPESYYLLAWVNLVTGEGVAEGVQLIRQATALAPGNQRYALVLAQLYLRQDKIEDARRIADLLSREGSDPGLRATAQSVLSAVNNYEEQLKKYKAAREEFERGGGGGTPHLVVREEDKETADKTATRPPKSEEERVAEAMMQAINDALRRPQEGETRVQAVLTRIECGPKGLVFVLRAGDRTLRLAAAGFGSLHLVSFNQDASGELTCGPRKVETPSVVTYRAAADARAKTDGALVALEFVPAKFQLKQ